MGRRKQAANIPDWFDLARYDPLNQFNIKQWALLQSIRLSVHRRLARFEAGDTNASYALEAHFKKIKRDPLFGLADETSLFTTLAEKMSGFTVAAISSLTVGTALRLIEDFRNEHPTKTKLLDEFIAGLRVEKEAEYSPRASKFLGKELAPNGNVISVNLRLKNSYLSDEFTDWIVSKRPTKKANTREQRGGSVARWASMGIVPYIDLAQWARYSGTRITKREIASCFSGKYLDPNLDIEQAISRRVMPEARLWLTEHTSQKLASEIRAAKLKNNKSSKTSR